ncbi:TlpA family protein disulfide reductase [Nocardioides sp.]|uniref:TlpA family protein disulfide reductase n=1 Tax=Nocardioides sp. TaxID=35761 RepID=UPI003517AE25
MSTGEWILIVAVVLALGFGLYRRRVDGRIRPARATAVPAGASTSSAATEEADAAPGSTDGGVLAGTPWSGQLGERATLLQFSSAFCAPCRSTRVVLADVAASTPGVAHVEVDAEEHLDLVRRLDVRRTPTTLVLDAAGREVGRAAGAARKPDVIAALAAL